MSKSDLQLTYSPKPPSPNRKVSDSMLVKVDGGSPCPETEISGSVDRSLHEKSIPTDPTNLPSKARSSLPSPSLLDVDLVRS